jgi:glutamine synthetase
MLQEPSSLKSRIEDLKEELKNDHRVKVAGVDLDGILRGKVMAKSKFLSILESGFGFCSVIFGWDMHDKTYPDELSVSNAANGMFIFPTLQHIAIVRL